MAKFINLSADQKEEIRRLTQLANRRIRAAAKEYKKEGLEILPREMVGDKQTREKWMTDKNPISRTTRFTSEADYKKQLTFLQSFEKYRPNMTEYTRVQQMKTKQAIETGMGPDALQMKGQFDIGRLTNNKGKSAAKGKDKPPITLDERLSQLTAPQLSKFWKKYSENMTKLGPRFMNTKTVMQITMEDLFPEDLQNVVD